MSSKKIGTHCNLLNYIKQVNSDLSALMKGLCVAKALMPRRGNEITFLMPSADKVKELYKMASSDKVEEADKAAKILYAHILSKKCTKGADFADPDLTNLLMPRQKIKVLEKSVNEAILEGPGGAKLKVVPDSKFIDRSYAKNIAVWNINGLMRTDGEEAPRREFAPRSSRKEAITGGVDDDERRGRQKSLALRESLYDNVMAEYAKSKSEGKSADVLLAISKEILLCLRDEGKLEKALPLMTRSYFDIYILLEPFGKKAEHEYLLSDDCIQKCTATALERQRKGTLNAVSYDDLLDSVKSDCAYCSRSAELQETIDQLRDDICSSGNQLQYKQQVLNLYRKLEQNNSIGNIQNVLPRSTHEFLKANPGLKLNYDELFFNTCVSWGRQLKRKDSVKGEVIDISDHILKQLESGKQVIFKRDSSKLFDDNNLITQFICSTAFLHVFYTAKSPNVEYVGGMPSVQNAGENPDVFDIEDHLYGGANREYAGGADSASIGLDDLVSILSQEQRQELLRKLQ